MTEDMYGEIGPGSLEDRLFDVLSDIATRFTHAKVTIEGENGPRLLKLFCTSGSAASVAIIPDPGQIDVFIGEEARFELLARGKSAKNPMQDIRCLLSAVVDGRFEEIVWEIRGRVIRSKAMVRLNDGEYKNVVSSWRLLGLLLPGHKRRIRYEPYE